MSDIEHIASEANGAIGNGDMTGKAARVAVEPSGSERDTMERLGIKRHRTHAIAAIARVDGNAARVAGASTGQCE